LNLQKWSFKSQSNPVDFAGELEETIGVESVVISNQPLKPISAKRSVFLYQLIADS